VEIVLDTLLWPVERNIFSHGMLSARVSGSLASFILMAQGCKHSAGNTLVGLLELFPYLFHGACGWALKSFAATFMSLEWCFETRLSFLTILEVLRIRNPVPF
jgi:hypothetical protein